MSEALTARAKKIWGENSFLLFIFAIGAAWVLLLGLVLLPLPPFPRDVAIQEIAALQRTAVSEQHMTNHLLTQILNEQLSAHGQIPRK